MDGKLDDGVSSLLILSAIYEAALDHYCAASARIPGVSCCQKSGFVGEGEIFMNLEELGKDLCYYANKATPPNWYIYTDPSEHRCSHRTLNIHILSIDTTPYEYLSSL